MYPTCPSLGTFILDFVEEIEKSSLCAILVTVRFTSLILRQTDRERERDLRALRMAEVKRKECACIMPISCTPPLLF